MIVKFTKKIKNNILNQNVFNDKINSDKFVDHYKKYKTLKFINWCFLHNIIIFIKKINIII